MREGLTRTGAQEAAEVGKSDAGREGEARTGSSQGAVPVGVVDGEVRLQEHARRRHAIPSITRSRSSPWLIRRHARPVTRQPVNGGHAYIANVWLMSAGFVLMGYQLVGLFINDIG